MDSRYSPLSEPNETGRPAAVDGRTRSARRLRDLTERFESQLAPEQRTLIAKELCRRLASLTLQAEQADTRLAAGETTDPADYCRLISVTNSLMRQLGLIAAPLPLPRKPRKTGAEPQTLEQYVAALEAGTIEPDLIPLPDGVPHRSRTATVGLFDDFRDDPDEDRIECGPRSRLLRPKARSRVRLTEEGRSTPNIKR